MDISLITRRNKKIDFFILLPTLALIGIGLAALYSATHGASVFLKFQKQAFWVVLGILLMVAVYFTSARFFHYSAYLVYTGALLLLGAVLIFGESISGSVGWFGIGSYGVQPSEFAKLATILALARYLSDSTTSLQSIPDILKSLLIVAVPWALILLQPDFGTGIVYWGIYLAMIFWAGAEMILLLTIVSPVIVAVLSILNIWWFLAAAVIIVGIFYISKRKLGLALMFLSVNLAVGFTVQYAYEQLPEYQRERVAVYLDPTRAPQTAGYNVLQSKVAIGSGGVTGRGYLEGSQTQLRFVPEQWTDFIYCVPAEEFGFIGASTILLLYLLLLLRGLYIARKLESRFSSLLVIGIVAMFAFHIFFNIGMTLGLIPVIGIPLPFMSYGGSFFLTSMLAIGLLLHAYSNLEYEA